MNGRKSTTRVPPHDLAAEEALLGVMLLPDAGDMVAAALAVCSAADLYQPAHGHIFEAVSLLHLRGQPADPVTVADALRHTGLLEAAGGAATLITLQSNAPSRGAVSRYATIVAEHAARRRLIGVANEVVELGFAATDDVNAVLLRAFDMLAEVARASANGRLALVPVDQVVPERVDWLWQGRLARGKVTVVDGDPGLGKSTITADLAARISTGSPMPDGSRLSGSADVIPLSAEDGVADTIRPRLEAAGADLTRVHAVDISAADPMVLPSGIGDLERAVTATGAVLVVIDPFVAFLSDDVNSYRDQDVRRVLAALAALAARTGVCVLLVRHLTKSTGGPAIYRGGGSIDRNHARLSAHARRVARRGPHQLARCSERLGRPAGGTATGGTVR